VLISGLAVSGIREDNGWLDAEDYIPKYSAVIKLARLIVVQEAYKRRREAITQYEGRGLSTKAAQEKASSYYVLTRSLVSAFMTMAHDGQDPKPNAYTQLNPTRPHLLGHSLVALLKPYSPWPPNLLLI
jgi:hypothetical protein